MLRKDIELLNNFLAWRTTSQAGADDKPVEDLLTYLDRNICSAISFDRDSGERKAMFETLCPQSQDLLVSNVDRLHAESDPEIISDRVRHRQEFNILGRLFSFKPYHAFQKLSELNSNLMAVVHSMLIKPIMDTFQYIFKQKIKATESEARQMDKSLYVLENAVVTIGTELALPELLERLKQARPHRDKSSLLQMLDNLDFSQLEKHELLELQQVVSAFVHEVLQKPLTDDSVPLLARSLYLLGRLPSLHYEPGLVQDLELILVDDWNEGEAVSFIICAAAAMAKLERPTDTIADPSSLLSWLQSQGTSSASIRDFASLALQKFTNKTNQRSIISELLSDDYLFSYQSEIAVSAAALLEYFVGLSQENKEQVCEALRQKLMQSTIDPKEILASEEIWRLIPKLFSLDEIEDYYNRLPDETVKQLLLACSIVSGGDTSHQGHFAAKELVHYRRSLEANLYKSSQLEDQCEALQQITLMGLAGADRLLEALLDPALDNFHDGILNSLFSMGPGLVPKLISKINRCIDLKQIDHIGSLVALLDFHITDTETSLDFIHVELHDKSFWKSVAVHKIPYRDFDYTSLDWNAIVDTAIKLSEAIGDSKFQVGLGRMLKRNKKYTQLILEQKAMNTSDDDILALSRANKAEDFLFRLGVTRALAV